MNLNWHEEEIAEVEEIRKLQQNHQMQVVKMEPLLTPLNLTTMEFQLLIMQVPMIIFHRQEKVK